MLPLTTSLDSRQCSITRQAGWQLNRLLDVRKWSGGGLQQNVHRQTNPKTCVTPAFPWTQKRAEMLCHPCILRDPRQRGTKSKVAASPLPSRVPKRGQKCYGFPAFSGIPNIGEQNQNWLPHPCLLGCPKEGGNATASVHSQGFQT